VISAGKILDASKLMVDFPTKPGDCAGPYVDNVGKVRGFHAWGSSSVNGGLFPGMFLDGMLPMASGESFIGFPLNPPKILGYGALPKKLIAAMTDVPSCEQSNFGSSMMMGSRLRWVSRLNKHTCYAKKEAKDETFFQYLVLNGIDPSKLTYGLAMGNENANFMSLRKYDQAQPKYNEFSWTQAVVMLRQSMSLVKRGALMEDPASLFDLSTSPGFPWTMEYHDKRLAMEDATFVAYLKWFANEIMAGRTPWCVATCVVKQEPKKMSKILKNDLRTILSMPVGMTYVGNLLFGDMNENYYQAAREFKIPSTVGTTKFYRGAHFFVPAIKSV